MWCLYCFMVIYFLAKKNKCSWAGFKLYACHLVASRGLCLVCHKLSLFSFKWFYIFCRVDIFLVNFVKSVLFTFEGWIIYWWILYYLRLTNTQKLLNVLYFLSYIHKVILNVEMREKRIPFCFQFCSSVPNETWKKWKVDKDICNK